MKQLHRWGNANMLSAVPSIFLTIAFLLGLLASLVFIAKWAISPVATLPGPQVTLPQFSIQSATDMPFQPNSKKRANRGVIVVTVTLSSGLFLDEKSVWAKDFHTELWKRIRQVENPAVYLKIDRALPYWQFIWATAGLKEVGVEEYYLVVRVQEQPHERVLKMVIPKWKPLPNFSIK
jgi:biopolymer transport protein ExbD